MIMRFKITCFTPLLLLIGLLVLSGCSDDHQSEPAEKEVAADFVLKLFDGRDFRLSEHRGKPVFINFWASWCIPCAEESPAIEQVYQEYSKKGVVFIGIAINDTETKAREFVDKFKLSFPIGLDPGDIHKSYPLYGVPTTVFIDKQGRINYLHMGGVTANLIRHELDKLL
jgi:cytochrome c biogenesis protein CcmG/thiol:disulfide interchange protein DsbE